MGWGSWLVWVLVLIGLLIFAFTGRPLAHDFYSIVCCDDKDCHPIDEKRVRHMGSDYLVDNKWIFSASEVKYSPDSKYHLCDPTPDIKPRCLYIPPKNS